MYIPPEQSRYFTEDELFELENEISVQRSQYDYVLITGDANAHTSNLPDFAEFDDFLS